MITLFYVLTLKKKITEIINCKIGTRLFYKKIT